nr:immunoglobulin light chain junction region [Macaca mulatta]MOV97330.1 immunoglobulin light chain junction region [Macaca mulatta]MOV98809.1 immunoglobulin light chain junction region [Macaca mulatta]
DYYCQVWDIFHWVF